MDSYGCTTFGSAGICVWGLAFREIITLAALYDAIRKIYGSRIFKYRD